MNILVNCSNLKEGGGLQVGDSLCCSLNRFKEHNFVVVLSSAMKETENRMEKGYNIRIYKYNVKNNFSTLVFGRDCLLDSLVTKFRIDVVLTVFGPSRWNPRCLHVSGFASSYLVLKDSPFYNNIRSLGTRCKVFLRNCLLTYLYKRSTRIFFTENPYISQLLSDLFPSSEVHTVTNYYNQIYDRPYAWKEKRLPSFGGVTMLTVTAAYPHKNLPIMVEIARILRDKYPDFAFRFVVTVNSQELVVPQSLKDYFLLIGRVDISECPSLYEQCDIMFQPSLLECFTATYPEAMKMKRPIITTDIEFAHGLCGDAAIYYEALSADSAANAIYKLSKDKKMQQQLVVEGDKQLMKFDNYETRANKLIGLLEEVYKKKN